MKAIFITLLGFLATACNDSSEGIAPIEKQTFNPINTLPVEPLNSGESEALIFMREEEKLARDVYVNLFNKWSIKSFDNISRSEQTHMDAVLSLIDKYGLDDPASENIYGAFVNDDLQKLYDDLTNTGSLSVTDALRVGAAIEEIDIIDLQRELDTNVDNADITLVFENLMKGSRNHLRAFVNNLSMMGITYEPQYLSQEAYDTIINTPTETGKQ
ncbi:MAG: DUF2202 domain-containing protein [Bacteroidota bacterium]